MRSINPAPKYLDLREPVKGPRIKLTREPVAAPARERGFKFKDDVKLDTTQIDDQRGKSTRTKTIRGRRVRQDVKLPESMKKRERALEKNLPRRGPKATGRPRSTNTG